MPFYTFENPKTGETVDIFFHMNDHKSYKDNSGLEWKRVFYPTCFAFDTQIDPHDPRAFVKKTEKNGTLGDIMDLSKEMSEKRGGVKNDEVKVKYDKDKESKLNKRRLENLREERKKQFEDFKKVDKTKIKIKKNTTPHSKNT